MNFFIERFWTQPDEAVIWSVIVVFSICFHEYCHARAAFWQGDTTAADHGHLTLNPLVQMGWISMVMLALIGFAWGSVPVNPNRMRNHRWGPAIVAASGPLANLLLALVFGIILAVASAFFPPGGNMGEHFYFFLETGLLLNMLLFLLNMIPCYPLDGWAILTRFLPMNRIPPETASIVSVILVFCVFSLSQYLFMAAAYLSYYWMLIVTALLGYGA